MLQACVSALAILTWLIPGPAPASASFKYRGVINLPSNHQEALEYIDFAHARDMNLVVHRDGRNQWRTPHTADELDRVKELAQRSSRVQIAYMVFPGESYCYANPVDFELLTARFTPMVGMGLRVFFVRFDDIAPTLACPLDVATYDNLGEAHADLMNRLLDWLPPDSMLILVPTEYWGTQDTDYKRALKTKLVPQVRVVWTGTEVVTDEIVREDAEKFRSLVGHEVWLWDNYPVNDWTYAQMPALFMGPLRGRAADLPAAIEGMVSNPMSPGEALSKVAIGTAAAYETNPVAYQDPEVREEVWEEVIREIGGPLADALRRIAAAARAGPSDGFSVTLQDPAPEYEQAVDAFWSSWGGAFWGQEAERLRVLMASALEAAAALGPPAGGFFGPETDAFRVKFEQGAVAILSASETLALTRPALDVTVSPQGEKVTLSGVASASRPVDVAVAQTHSEREAAAYRAIAVRMYGPFIEVFFSRAREELEAYLQSASTETPPHISTVVVQGTQVPVDRDGFFTHAVQRVPGNQVIEVVASDSWGRVTGVSVSAT